MKKTVKLIIVYTVYGISFGCTFFVLLCLWYSIRDGNELSILLNDFVRQALGSIIVGIACGGTAVVYQFNRPSVCLKIIIHFCIGMGVFYPTAIHLGWIPFYPDRISYTILQFVISCCIFMAIWSCFYLWNRQEAKKMNQKLREYDHTQC